MHNQCQCYGLDDPLECLKFDPPSKSAYKELVRTKICAYYEQNLRDLAENNSQMTYLNVSLSGLNGRHHPALSDIVTTTEVQKSRIHLKMLAGDYFTYGVKANQSGGSPQCRCCPSPSPDENISHILTVSVAYVAIRNRMIPEFGKLCNKTKT